MTRITLRKELINSGLKELESKGYWGTSQEIVMILIDTFLNNSRIREALDYSSKIPKSPTDHAVAQKTICEEIEGYLNIIPDLNKKAWIRVINRLIEEKEIGNTIENYSRWYNATDEFTKPKRFKIQENPALIFSDWKLAQKFNSGPILNDDGTLYV